MGLWAQASEIAAVTPAERNRYVDFLRAASILFVISGHWLITTGYLDPNSGAIEPVIVLQTMPWTQWLTWGFQVMPIFFIVGGYSNAVSLHSAQRKGIGYAAWLASRLHRLLSPMLLLVLVWVLIALLLARTAVESEQIVFLSRSALVPTWFLAIYTMIVLLAPATLALWRRWGMASLLVYILLAALCDLAFFNLQWRWLGWSNYFWVWLAMHHLGFAWRDGRLGTPLHLLALSALALATLAALIGWGPYPVAMAGSPEAAVSNTLPPKITLVALGLFQFGLLLSMEKPIQRWLARRRPWTLTVIINTMIMTIYLWHMTALLLVLVASYGLGGWGLGAEPGSAPWWLTRPLWLALLALALVPFALVLSPLERNARPADGPTLPAWRLVGGATMVGLGLTLATLYGFDGNPFSLISSVAVLLLLGGAWLSGVPIPFISKRGTAGP